MSIVEDALKGNVVTGLAIGVGAALLVPAVMPLLVGVVRPIAKAAIKSGFILYEWGREYVAEAGELASDLVAEAKAELAAIPAGAAAAAEEPAEEGEGVRAPGPARRKSDQ
jgi:hypothetical protein